jgi:hypothetical protein
VIVVTNPLDAMVYAMQKVTGIAYTFNWTVQKYWSKGDITNQHITLWIRNSITEVNYVFLYRSFPSNHLHLHLHLTQYCTFPQTQFGTTFPITVSIQRSSYKPIPRPRGLRRCSAAARLLGLQIRIPPGA